MLICGYTEILNFSERCIEFRIGTAEQEISHIELCRENSFVVSLCLMLTDSDKPFLLHRFQAEATAVSGCKVL